MILSILIALNGFTISCQETKAPKSNVDAMPRIEESVIVDVAETTAEKVVELEVTEETLTPQGAAVTKPTPQSVVAETTIQSTEHSVVSEEIEELAIEESTKSTVVEEVETKPVVKDKIAAVIKSPIEKTMHVAHGDFEAILQKHVKNGLVNYAGIKADGKLEGYLKYLDSHAPSTSDKSKSALAFWMNAYNAFTIKLIIDNYPLESIMDLDGGKVWDRKWIEMGGKTYSLNDIEHNIIRPVFNEPRIHFAVVCAAKSCPPLDSKAFFGSTVDGHLERLTKDFINNTSFNQITEKKATVTPIFDWYAKDFGNVKDYVRKYASVNLPEKFKLGYTNYDWSLNKQ